jgi:hypothetical protein
VFYHFSSGECVIRQVYLFWAMYKYYLVIQLVRSHGTTLGALGSNCSLAIISYFFDFSKHWYNWRNFISNYNNKNYYFIISTISNNNNKFYYGYDNIRRI